MNNSIAIDGPAGAGKSTVAKLLAKQMGIHYLNTGAMYRALALLATRNGIAFSDEQGVGALLVNAVITVFYQGDEQHTVLNGEDVTELLLCEQISMGASTVSKLPCVRDTMAALQRKIAHTDQFVLEGRDIGTNVLPDTPYKFFVTASSSERAKRRQLQLESLGQSVDYNAILKDLEIRDKQDTERSYMPLKMADDAVLIDTTTLSIAEAVQKIRAIVEGR